MTLHPRQERVVLHGPRRCGAAPHSAAPPDFAAACGPLDSRGSTLVELLICLSVITIGVLAAVGGGLAVRRHAEQASRRAAEALAAQQVLETWSIGASADPAWIDTLRIGVREVQVRIETRDSLPGLVRIRVQAEAGAGTEPWELETLRRRE